MLGIIGWALLISCFSLALIVSSYFIGSVDFFQFTISERILLGVVLLDVLLSFNIHNHLLEYRAYNLKEIKRIEYTTQRKHYVRQASYLIIIWLLSILVFNIDLWLFLISIVSIISACYRNMVWYLILSI